MEKEFIQVGSVIDTPDSRDYDFAEFAKEFAEGERATARPNNEITIQNQGQTPACTRYALTYIYNGQNINEYNTNGNKFKQIDPAIIWEKSNKIKNIQSAMSEFRLWGMIEGNTVIQKDANCIANIKKSLSMGCYILTGSDNGLWGIYRAPFNYMKRTDGRIVGHARSIVADDSANNRFKVVNSFGSGRGELGYFYLPYDDIKYCFSLNSIIDKDDSGKFKIFKNQQKAKELVSALSAFYQLADPVVQKSLHDTANILRTTYGLSV